MKELHAKLIDPKIEPKEGQCDDLACSNKKSITHCPSLRANPTLSKDTLDALEGLGDILKSIRERMYNEGHEIINGMVQKSNVQ